MTDGLSPADRARVVSELNETAFNLNAAAVVLEQADAGAAAGMVEAAATRLAAACWVLHKAGMGLISGAEVSGEVSRRAAADVSAGNQSART
jgi:hypothetical protein